MAKLVTMPRDPLKKDTGINGFNDDEDSFAFESERIKEKTFPRPCEHLFSSSTVVDRLVG